MRIYSASSEETLRARKLLTEWAGEGFLTKAQYQVLEQETVSELRTTNIFLRLVLFFFTVIIVGAAAALFLVVFLSRPSDQTTGVFLLIFAVVCYAAAELAVSRARLYRYGIEEALAVCSVGFLCAGMQFALFSGSPILRSRTQPVPGSRGRRRLFALDMATLRVLLCISCGDDLRRSFFLALGHRRTRRSI